jgi:hypothetical protein
MGKKLDKATKEQVLSLIEQGMNHRQIAEELGLGVGTISKIRNETPDPPLSHPKPSFDLPPHAPLDPVEFLRKAAERTKSHSTDKDTRTIKIATSKPIAVMKAADLHFGGLDIDYASLQAHVEFLLNNDNFYLQLFGDDLNLMIMHRTASARHDGWTPEEQVSWLESFVDVMLKKGKLLSMSSGNHTDEFTERNAGFGLVRMLMKRKVPYFRGLGMIHLRVGKQDYPLAFVHKTRFNSFMNPTHGNKRMLQMHPEFFGKNEPIACEYIAAHTHSPGTATQGCLHDQRIYFIKCGTFKTNCLYSQRYFGQGQIGVPTVVYHPDRFQHVLFQTPQEAAVYMRGLGQTTS